MNELHLFHDYDQLRTALEKVRRHGAHVNVTEARAVWLSEGRRAIFRVLAGMFDIARLQGMRPDVVFVNAGVDPQLVQHVRVHCRDANIDWV